MPTANGRSKNHPAENPVTVVGAVAASIVAFAMWGLDSVDWPANVEAALLGLAIAAGAAIGKFTQRWTKRVYYGPAPDSLGKYPFD